MVTRGTQYLTIDIFLNVVVTTKFLLHISGIYSMWLVAIGSNGSALSITITGNVVVARKVLPLEGRPFLDFFMIH